MKISISMKISIKISKIYIYEEIYDGIHLEKSNWFKLLTIFCKKELKQICKIDFTKAPP